MPSFLAYRPNLFDSRFLLQVIDTLKVWVPEVVARDSIPGSAIVIVNRDDVLWIGTFGHTDTSGTKAVTDKTLFSIQSMTKSFTALAVLSAIQDELVELDAPINSYLPEFSVKSIFEEKPERKITLRHLLSHMAGLAHEAPIGNNYEDFENHPYKHTFEEHVQSISETWLRYPVGYCWSYSNLGFDLAGRILQVVSGQPYEQYVQDRVLLPMSMEASAIDTVRIAASESVARGFLRGSYEIPVQIPQIAAGGIYTNVLDMATYLRFHLNRGALNGYRFIDEELWNEMYRVPFPRLNQRHGYCLGLWKQRVSQTYSLYHGGAGFGFSSGMVWFPDLHIGVAMLTNSEQNGLNTFSVRMIIEALIRSHLGDGDAVPITISGTEHEPLESASDEVQRLLGRYGGTDARWIEIRDSEIGVAYSADEFYPLTLMATGEGYLGKYASYSELQILPRLGDRPGTIIIKNRWVDIPYFFDYNDGLHDPPGPDRPEWDSYPGQYHMFYLGTPIGPVTISKKNGYIYCDDDRCSEHLDGLFFRHDGEVLDFRAENPMLGQRPLHRID